MNIFNPDHCRPFNLEHAKAGAPVGTMGNYPIRIICFDRDGKFPIVALVKTGVDGYDPSCDCEDVISYLINGKCQENREESLFDLVMLPLGYCQGKSVHVGDVLLNICTGFSDRRVIVPADSLWENKQFDEFGWTWPIDAPEMPTFDLIEFEKRVRNFIGYNYTQAQEFANDIFHFALTQHRKEIAEYLRKLEEYERQS